MSRVLDVGQCAPDHMGIRRVAESLGAEVAQVALPADALALLRHERYDLVLVNRKIDADYSDGMELVHALQREPELAGVPVMLVSNYAEAQAQAVAAGAVQGFGKSALHTPEVRNLLARYLGDRAASA